MQQPSKMDRDSGQPNVGTYSTFKVSDNSGSEKDTSAELYSKREDISSDTSSSSQPPTPPPPYIPVNGHDYEESATLLNRKEKESKHALQSLTTDDNFDSVVEMELSEKDPMWQKDVYIEEEPIVKFERPGLVYRVSQRPPLHLLLFFAIQQCLIVVPSSVKVTMLVSEVMCARDEADFKVQIMSMSLLMSGMCTFLQNTIGIRIPLYQGPVSMYVLPLLAVLDLPEYACPSRSSFMNQTLDNTTNFNSTSEAIGITYFQAVVIPRFLQLSGTLILAGFLHMLVGVTGTVGIFLRFIGPITIIPTILLVGINVFTVTYMFCSTHWGVSISTASIAILLSMYLDRHNMPIPVWTKEKGFHIIRYPLHQVFSVLVAGGIGWILSVILTKAGAFSDDPKSPEFYARTDSRNTVIAKTPWLVFPYPGMYGLPGFDVGVFAAFLTATITSIIDSIADYYAASRVARVPSPPVHAINRGVAIEGFMSMLAGLWGASHATTTYGGIIGLVGLTKVASRHVFQMLGILLMVLAVLGKVAGVLVTIPYPVVGGIQVVGFGIFIGLVFGNCQYIDMNSTRNLAVIGISILWGLVIPYWSKLRGDDVINTGNTDADNFLKMITRNPNFSGFLIALILDNTVPGTLEERGMIVWQATDQDDEKAGQNNNLEEGREVYDIPVLSKFLRKYRISSYIPFLPTYSARRSKKSN
ncbi:solute carrier family 23 member 1-like [Ostrea edulis]|uniref:solute carrier family 23 member 1-like n=1 Tax=Ostrea edulis TaxID=37623 RepID=UPI0024AFC52E|nr:solute carrier family 23 member 1-like [Ostrea edulis]